MDRRALDVPPRATDLPPTDAFGKGTVAPQNRYRRYPAYKRSGIDWLGEIPADWQVKPLKFVAAVNSEVLDEATAPDYEVLYVDISNVDSAGRIGAVEELRFDGAPSRARRRVRSGDSILSTVRTYLKAIAYIDEPPDNLIVSTGFAVLRPTPAMHPRFLWRMLQSHQFVEAAVAHSEGVGYPAISPSTLGRLPVCIPSPLEQRAIAAFLDRETAKIDAIVAKNEKLIGLLQERRIALITRTVTKGLGSDVPMMNSGLDWLGDVPAHWEIAPVYSRYEVALGKMLDAKQITGQYLAPYVRNVDVQWDHVNVDGLPLMDFAPAERDRYLLRRGDLLVCEGGEVGRTAIWRGDLQECFYQKAIHRVRPIRRSEYPRFFYYLMLAASARGVFVADGNPNTIDHLTEIQLRHYRFPFPPAQEQRAIADFLDRETAKIDVLEVRVRQAVERLQEYRGALIAAAVTGKIDVRRSERYES